jgi:hypothetical protein
MDRKKDRDEGEGIRDEAAPLPSLAALSCSSLIPSPSSLSQGHAHRLHDLLQDGLGLFAAAVER